MSRPHLKTELVSTKNGVERLKREIHEAESGACYKSAPRIQALVAGKKTELASLEARLLTLLGFLGGSSSEEVPRKETPKNTIVAYRPSEA